LALPAASDCVAYVKKHFIWEKVSRRVLQVYNETFRTKQFKLGRSPSTTIEVAA
jgi:hypothetical protein